mmetsp:Transcript_96331/g.171188  ORF Transcript_96331/g.171188 Transcript_96331/m.171188 type:complete len:237 (-) Transcript_96331:75-785(-)
MTLSRMSRDSSAPFMSSTSSSMTAFVGSGGSYASSERSLAVRSCGLEACSSVSACSGKTSSIFAATDRSSSSSMFPVAANSPFISCPVLESPSSWPVLDSSSTGAFSGSALLEASAFGVLPCCFLKSAKCRCSSFSMSSISLSTALSASPALINTVSANDRAGAAALPASELASTGVAARLGCAGVVALGASTALAGATGEAAAEYPAPSASFDRRAFSSANSLASSSSSRSKSSS